MQVRLVLLTSLVLTLGLCGCFPPNSPLDEEKESHFLAGKARVNALDFQGGLECFEKAIEANPRSAVAHFEAGLICEKQNQDHAAAIYHFERFLKLRPESGYAGVVRQHIFACKQELARSVSLMPITRSLQKEFEVLSEENKSLRQEVEAWRAKARAQNLALTTSTVPSTASTSVPGVSSAVQSKSSFATNTLSFVRTIPPTAAGRTHTVKSGETPVGIARKYGVRLETLMAANPRLEARRLRVGQSVILPVQ